MENVGKEPVRPVRITHQSHMNVMKLSLVISQTALASLASLRQETVAQHAQGHGQHGYSELIG